MTYVEDTTDALNAAIPGLEPDLVRVYALLALTHGTDTTLADVHDAWAVWRDQAKPGHPAIRPFEELAPEVQELDRPYMRAIHEVARFVHRDRGRP